MTCAVIKDNKVINIIVGTPEVSTPPDNCTLVLIPDNIFVNMNFTWDGTNFIDLDGNPSLPIEQQIQASGGSSIDG